MHFDPFNYLSSRFSEQTTTSLSRMFLFMFEASLVMSQLQYFSSAPNKLLWCIELTTSLFLVFAALTRLPPVQRSSGILEILLPFFVIFYSFIFFTSRTEPLPSSSIVRILFEGGLILSWCFVGYSFWFLRSCFSITAEARGIIKTGPYARIRHPAYFGEIIYIICIIGLHYSIKSLFAGLLLIILLLIRARVEEKKLLSVFGVDYQRFASTRYWFWKISPLEGI